MLKCVSLNTKNIKDLYELNSNRLRFNSLNEDFFLVYNNQSYIKQFILRKKIKLLKSEGRADGYLWTEKTTANFYRINSLFVDTKDVSATSQIIERYSKLINSINLDKPLIYSCEKNKWNYEILKSIGFRKLEGTYEMSTNISNLPLSPPNSELKFKILQKHEQEHIRCFIQNEVFKNDSRTPLTMDDMYYDEEQDYYFDEGAILVKKANTYIGYGQIIKVQSVPTIVNVGILKEYRGMGYGKELMLYLLYILKKNNLNDVNLKVSSDNYTALTMYKTLGFNIINQIYDFEYRGF